MHDRWPPLIPVLGVEDIFGPILEQFVALPLRTWTQDNVTPNIHHISLRNVLGPRPFIVVCIVQPCSLTEPFFCASIPTEREIREGRQYTLSDAEHVLRMVSIIMRYFIENTANGNIGGRPGAWFTDNRVVSCWMRHFFLSAGVSNPEIVVMELGDPYMNRAAMDAWTAFSNLGRYYLEFRDSLFA
ncbi:hypothetical protein B7494_g8268 [Chlorociboria aeruginascens]|nr:hypothetical protein B7494_g8268 [Chlorociboria aeruginascens]